MTNPPVTPKALSAGQKRTHPAYIPSHFPEFPDPHTYIKTPVSQTFLGLLDNKSWNSVTSPFCNFLWWQNIINYVLSDWSTCKHLQFHNQPSSSSCVTDKILKVNCVSCCFPRRRSESLCRTTKWWEKRQQHRGETWSEHSRASWPRLEKLRASSKTTSLPSHVSICFLHVFCATESLFYLNEF